MPCSKYKGKQRKACYATGGWRKKTHNPYGPKTGRKKAKKR